MDKRNQEKTTGIRAKDFIWIGLFCLVPLFLFGGTFFLGKTFFWGDLLYLHFPWKSAVSESVVRGTLPLWNPYAYLGMPLAAELQCGAWYPGSVLFYLFSFPSALAIYHTLHYSCTGIFAFLWLRRIGFTRSAAAGGAAVFMLCGGIISRIPFLNHLSTLMYFPALLLFAYRPILLGLVFALAFLGGYPTMLVGEIAAAGFLHFVFEKKGRGGVSILKKWSMAAVLSVGISACLLLPAARLVMDSTRGRGMESKEVLTWSFSMKDLIQLTAPPVIKGKEYSPTINWWKSAYFGLAGCALALAGAWTLAPAAAAAAGAYMGITALIVMGGTNPISKMLWTHIAPLSFVRYPGNMAYLFIPMMVLLVSWGLLRRRWAPWAVLLLVLELSVYAAGSQPVVARNFFSDSGPLTQVLHRELKGHRYLLSPLALHWHRGKGDSSPAASLDLKHRLYGLTNVPYHLSSVGNFGEPLVPAPTYDFMDFIFSRSSLAEAAAWLDWADVRILMTRDRFPAGKLEYWGDSLWHIYGNTGDVSRAYWLDEGSGKDLPADLGKAPPSYSRRISLNLYEKEADRFFIEGEFKDSGWVYLSQPLGRGWSVRQAGKAIKTRPALRAFHRIPVPAGKWRLNFHYNPLSWRVGRALTLLFLFGLAAYWYNRIREYVVVESAFGRQAHG